MARSTGDPATADMFSKEKRSEIMRSVKSRGTGLEKEAAKMLRLAKLHYRSHPKMYGSPDFLVEGRLALFCDGSFWHGRDWENLRKRLESGNDPDYWVKHIESNRKRDEKVNRMLAEQGRPFLRLWDTDVKKRPGWCVREIRRALGLETQPQGGEPPPRGPDSPNAEPQRNRAMSKNNRDIHALLE